MKKTFLALVILISAFSSAQQLYEGEAEVAFAEGPVAVITFGREGHPPTSFVVGNPTEGPKLVSGKRYYFFLEGIKEDRIYKRTKRAKVMKHTYSEVQLNKERRDFQESVNINFTWL